MASRARMMETSESGVTPPSVMTTSMCSEWTVCLIESASPRGVAEGERLVVADR